MSKYSLILSICAIACLFIGCNNHCDHVGHPELRRGHREGGHICFFQFRDTSYLNKIIVWDARDADAESEYFKNLCSNYEIPLFPKNIEGQPIFGVRTGGKTYIDFDYLDGCFYTVEDVVESPKFIALKGDYYMCYPFTALELHGHYINAEWKDFYTTDFNKVEKYTFPYKKRYHISEHALVHLTQKSTLHFLTENAEMITIDDVVETLNELIETNRIDNWCYEVYN